MVNSGTGEQLTPISRSDAEQVMQAQHGDPFSVLGLHEIGGRPVIRALVPGAEHVEVIDRASGRKISRLERIDDGGLFAGFVPRRVSRLDYLLEARRGEDRWLVDDPYRYSPVLGTLDEYLIAEGSHLDLDRRLGAHPLVHEGSAGTLFAVWAPNAKRVSVVGDFNGWDGRRHVMRRRGSSGVHEIFAPGVGEGDVYKYEICCRDGRLLLKADPLAFGAEKPPKTASVVRDLSKLPEPDSGWIAGRAARNATTAPISIYEVHLGSWRRGENNRYLTYRELAEVLVAHVVDMGFTHVELLPISEYPFDGSWGYQPTGLFAPTSRYGTAADFLELVAAFHRAGIAVILDWVPGHFPSDAHGLAEFDGTALYEHADPQRGFHPDWHTFIYNYGRREVANFLIANALYWPRVYGIDGLRVDAVASMLYLDYSRKPGEWVPNIHGGRENLEAIAFLKRMNETVYDRICGVTTIAEESTAWPGVSRPTDAGGLGFGYKWNMGFMHDTLAYMGRDPIHRRYHHTDMTFGMMYAYTENFVLPLSHDEVVHGKGALFNKMWGDEWQKFASLRAYYAFMWSYPGKKLLFMGGEFAQRREWNHDIGLDWHLASDPRHGGVQSLVRDLNRVYREIPALHRGDCREGGFEWIDADAAEFSTYFFARYGEWGDRPVVVLANFTPVPRNGVRVGLPASGGWRERINTDAREYGGSGLGNFGRVETDPIEAHGRPQSALVRLPPLAVIILEHEG